MDSTPFECADGPPEWAVEASAGDPRDPVGPIPPVEADECLALGQALAAVFAGQAAVIDAAVNLVVEVRDRVMERKGLAGVELGRTAARSVLAEVRRCAVTEVQVKAGYGVTEARTLVALALAPRRLRAVLTGAMRRGESSWPLVRRFWESSSHLTDDQRHLVAVALFGTDEGIAVPERLDPEGRLLLGQAWSHDEFTAACDREVTACEGVDVAAERERRRRAYAGRSTSLRMNDDGTGTLSVRGPLTAMAAVYARVDKGARNARALGDERTLANLRCDLVSALLIYGTVDLPSQDPSLAPERGAPPAEDDPPSPDGDPTPPEEGPPLPGVDDSSGLPFDEIIAPEEMDRLVRVINALPPVALQVVVPLDVLSPVIDRCPGCGETAPSADSARPSAPPDRDPAEDVPDRPPAQEPPDGSAQARPDDPVGVAADPPVCVAPDAPALARATDDPVEEESSVPEWMRVLATWLPEGPGRGLVGEVLGPTPFSISPGLARELALTPGATIHRLVTDPMDGRCVERSAKGYRPDADMRRQIHAADVYSRAPGSRTHAAACELDHVTPWGWAGGPTTETNLAMLDLPSHRSKTEGYLGLTINHRRDLTFTTLLGQVVRTRAHDYGQYLHHRAPDDLATRRDLANRLVYAAYAADPHRGEPPSGLRGPREHSSWITLTHTVLGRRHAGAAPGTPTVTDLLRECDAPADDGDTAA